MRKFGMLFQGGALFDSLTVWENIAFRLIYADNVTARRSARARDRDDAQSAPRARIRRRAARSNFPAACKSAPALRAPSSPSPTSSSSTNPPRASIPSPPTRSTISSSRWSKELGCAAVSITHDMASARKIADEIAMLHAGKIVWRGPARAHRQFRQRHGRSIRRRPRRRADPGGGLSQQLRRAITAIQRFRLRCRRKARDHFAVAADQELGEIPFDLAAEQAAAFLSVRYS